MQYCQETLANHKSAIGFEDIMQAKKTNLERNLIKSNGSFMPTKEGFQTLLKKFKLSRKQNYVFFSKIKKIIPKKHFLGFLNLSFRKKNFLIALGKPPCK